MLLVAALRTTASLTFSRGTGPKCDQVWLALEAKGVAYATERRDADAPVALEELIARGRRIEELDATRDAIEADVAHEHIQELIAAHRADAQTASPAHRLFKELLSRDSCVLPPLVRCC